MVVVEVVVVEVEAEGGLIEEPRELEEFVLAPSVPWGLVLVVEVEVDAVEVVVVEVWGLDWEGIAGLGLGVSGSAFSLGLSSPLPIS